jgi:hypothetical protein
VKEKILISLFFLAAFINFLGPIVCPDFPFHLETGEYIYQHRAIPADDPFSFYGEGIQTDREKFTLSQYWITQIIFYQLYSFFGPAGIILLRAIIFSSFVFLLWFVLRKRGIYSSLVIASLIAIMLQASKLDRPQLFSFLFMLILVLLLERFREKPAAKAPLIFIPPLMLMWANMHAGFVFGIAVIMIYALAESLKLLISKSPFGQPLEKKPALILLTTILLTIIFSYINPCLNGQLLETLNSHTDVKWLYSENREYISPVKEMGVHFGNRISVLSFFFIFGYVIIVMVLNFFRSKSFDITAFSLIAFSSVAAFTSVRYIPFFVAIAIPFSRKYTFFSDSDPTKKLRANSIMFYLLLIFFTFTIVFGLKNYSKLFGIDISQYPEGAASFLLANRIDANMFNQHNKGSYLIWRLYPNYKVFNDTRFISLEAIYDTDVIAYSLEDYKQPTNVGLANALTALVPDEMGRIDIFSQDSVPDIKNHKPLWKKLLEQYNINLIVHEACSHFTKELYPIILRLIQDDEWALIYLDGTMLIFIRDVEKYSDIIEKYKLPKTLIYDEIIFETMPVVSQRATTSTPYSSLAFAFMMKGRETDSKKMIEAALELNQNDLVAHFCRAYLSINQ